jgi:hypothetical protein
MNGKICGARIPSPVVSRATTLVCVCDSHTHSRRGGTPSASLYWKTRDGVRCVGDWDARLNVRCVVHT